jgi:ATP-dependent Clp protease ATP-binding subunit ClpC
MRSAWDRLTESAKQAVLTAREEARRRGEQAVMLEHLLLGILQLPESPARRVLERLGVDQKALAAEVRELLPVVLSDGSPEIPAPKTVLFDYSVRHAVHLCLEETEEFKNHFIGTEHLLIGIYCQEDSDAANLLRRHGVAREKLRIPTRTLYNSLP